MPSLLTDLPTAVHESGHAVIARMFKVPVLCAKISHVKTEEIIKSFAYCNVRLPDLSERDSLAQAIVILFAGPIAEQLAQDQVFSVAKTMSDLSGPGGHDVATIYKILEESRLSSEKQRELTRACHTASQLLVEQCSDEILGMATKLCKVRVLRASQINRLIRYEASLSIRRYKAGYAMMIKTTQLT